MTTNDAKASQETHSFQAEVAQLLRLMVHSVYSESDVFLRELISNASDACDRLRYEAIAKPELMGDGAALAIRIRPDEKAGTLTIADTGIGMDRQELIDNLGTIARSGTRAFLSKLAEAKDGTGLIGQFGVGFYSAFMVADRIEVTSRRAGRARRGLGAPRAARASRWRRPARMRPSACRAARRSCCTSRRDAKRYLEAAEIERIVHTYSDHILFPDRARDQARRGAPDQRGERAVAAAQVGDQARGLHAGLSHASRAPSTSRP